MPFITMHVSYCHACLLLSYMPPIIMHVSHCHAYLSLPCMPFTAMHAFHCHACQDIPTLATFLLCNEYSPTQVPLLTLTSHCRMPPTAVYLPLPCMPLTGMHASHYHACQDSPDTGNFSFMQSYSSIFRKKLIDALISNLHLH
jgi:hypothetical protein